MALPKPQLPLTKIQLPSSKKIVELQPFLVSQKKAFKIGIESEDEKDARIALKNLIQGCLVTKLDLYDLPLVDIEYIFIQLKIMSEGSIIPLGYICPNDKCKSQIDLDVDLEKFELKQASDPEPDKKIRVSDDMTLIANKPRSDMFFNVWGNLISSANTNKKIDEFNELLRTLMGCITSIVHGDDIFHLKDSTPEEIQEFFDVLPTKTLDDLEEYTSDIDMLSINKKAHCTKCGTEIDIEFEGIQDFLD